jgi:hypothetical protein
MPDSAGIWVNEFLPYHFDDLMFVVYDDASYVNYCTNGVDTLIGIESYTIIDTCLGGYKGAFREDSGQVYYVPKGEVIEYLLYDFTAIDGDTLYDVYIEEDWPSELAWDLYDLEVTIPALDSILVGGIYRKLMFAGNAEWIEGIGSKAGLFKGSGENVSNYFISLFCHSELDNGQFPIDSSEPCYLFNSIADTNPISLSVFPNPTAGRLTIDASNFKDSFHIEVYNLLGELVFQDRSLQSAETVLNLASLSQGNYLLILHNENSLYKKKIVKL